jgi:hypothetical protein
MAMAINAGPECLEMPEGATFVLIRGRLPAAVEITLRSRNDTSVHVQHQDRQPRRVNKKSAGAEGGDTDASPRVAHQAFKETI